MDIIETLIRFGIFVITLMVIFKVYALILKHKNNKEFQNAFADIYAWYGKNPLTDLNNNELIKGNVKKITRYYTKIEKETIKKDGIRFIATYNEKQKITDSTIYEADGSIKKKTAYQYDANYNLIAEMGVGTNGKTTPSATHRYNEKNQNIETTFYDDGKVGNTLKNIYDENGNMTETHWIDQDGRTISKDFYVYNEKNEFIKFTSQADTTETKEVYILDENGLAMEVQTVDIQTGEIKHKNVYTYSGDKILEITGYEGDVMTDKDVYVYNHDGRLSEIRSFDKQKTLVEKEMYLYDQKGSRCGVKEYKNGQLTFCYMDEIEYYD